MSFDLQISARRCDERAKILTTATESAVNKKAVHLYNYTVRERLLNLRVLNSCSMANVS